MGSFISKVELKKQLQAMGVKVVEGNYVKKSEITKVLAITWEPELDEYVHFVDKESPASSDETKVRLAKTLKRICEKHNEPKERAWLIERYWE